AAVVPRDERVPRLRRDRAERVGCWPGRLGGAVGGGDEGGVLPAGGDGGERLVDAAGVASSAAQLGDERRLADGVPRLGRDRPQRPPVAGDAGGDAPPGLLGEGLVAVADAGAGDAPVDRGGGGQPAGLDDLVAVWAGVEVLRLVPAPGALGALPVLPRAHHPLAPGAVGG